MSLTKYLYIMYNYKQMENLGFLAADMFEDLYNSIDITCTEVIALLIHKAVKFEEELDWKDNDERDYIDELEKFEAKIREEYGITKQ